MTQFSSTPEQLVGRTAIDSAGDKIGKIGQVYVDDQSGQPVWITVSTGLFGTKQSLAPLGGAREQADDLLLAVTKQQIKDAPNVEADGHLSDTEQDELYRYYGTQMGMLSGERTETSPRADSLDHTDTTDRGIDRGTDEAITRSEERLHVGTERVETGRARLRKFIVTENVTQTVPVSHEEIRLVREPIAEGDRGEAVSSQELTEAEHEVTLHAERVVVNKETVPVERVALATETVTGEESIDETVRKERVELEDSDNPRATTQK